MVVGILDSSKERGMDDDGIEMDLCKGRRGVGWIDGWNVWGERAEEKVLYVCLSAVNFGFGLD